MNLIIIFLILLTLIVASLILYLKFRRRKRITLFSGSTSGEILEGPVFLGEYDPTIMEKAEKMLPIISENKNIGSDTGFGGSGTGKGIGLETDELKANSDSSENKDSKFDLDQIEEKIREKEEESKRAEKKRKKRKKRKRRKTGWRGFSEKAVILRTIGKIENAEEIIEAVKEMSDQDFEVLGAALKGKGGGGSGGGRTAYLFRNPKVKRLISKAGTRTKLIHYLKQEAIDNLKRASEEIKKQISKRRKKGIDVGMQSIKILKIPPKIKIFEATSEKEDFYNVKKILIEIEQELKQLDIQKAEEEKERKGGKL